MISCKNSIQIYDQKSFVIFDTIDVPHPEYIKHESDEYQKKLEILSMKLSHNSQFLAVMIGHQLINDESENYLMILY